MLLCTGTGERGATHFWLVAGRGGISAGTRDLARFRLTTGFPSVSKCVFRVAWLHLSDVPVQYPMVRCLCCALLRSLLGADWQRRRCLILQCQLVHTFIQCIVLATEETPATQQVSYRPIKCQSRSWSQSDKVNGPHHGDNPLLKSTGIEIATKFLPDLTNRKHRKLIGVKTISTSGYFRPPDAMFKADQHVAPRSISHP